MTATATYTKNLTVPRARQYDPVVGRFLAVDPLARRGELPQISGYLYADAQPSVLVDPSGGGALAPSGALQASTRFVTSYESADSFTRVHDDVVRAVAIALRSAAARLVGKFGRLSVTTLRADNELVGASGGIDGNNGFADMILWYDRAQTAFIWEFKKVGRSATGANAQLQRYVDAVPRTRRSWQGSRGFPLPRATVPITGGVADVFPARERNMAGIEWYSPRSTGRRGVPAFDPSPELVKVIAEVTATALLLRAAGACIGRPRCT